MIKERPLLSLRHLLRITVVFGGIQFSWALQLALLTPFVQSLGIPHAFASFMWLCGPISGFIMQPLIGVFSDRCRSKYGRRRPFIVAGVICIVVSQLLIANSSDLGYLLGDPTDPSATKTKSIVFFVIGFWLLDFSNNAVMGPCRALIVDLAPKEQQALGNSMFSGWIALGNVLGYIVGALPGWATWFPFQVTAGCPVDCANLRVAFIIAACLLILTAVITCLSAHETPLGAIVPQPSLDAHSEFAGKQLPDTSDLVPQPPQQNVFMTLLHGVIKMDGDIFRICIVNFFSWVAWFTFLLYDTDWFGRHIFQGSPATTATPQEKLLYQRGVSFGAYGLMAQACVSWGVSLVITPLANRFSPKWVWVGSQCVFAVSMLCTLFVPPGEVVGGIAIFAFLGISWAVTMVIPYALVGQVSKPENRGRDQGVLNIFIVTGQLIIALSVGPFDNLFGGSDTPGFMLGAGAGLLAGVLGAILLRMQKPDGAEGIPLLGGGGH